VTGESGEVLVAAALLVALVAAVVDNRRTVGPRLAGRRRDADLRPQAPDPRGRLSPSDRDAWSGPSSPVPSADRVSS
jgi:hypothetical protein